MTTDLRPLGRTRLRVSAIGLGCWQFSEGHGLAGRYWPDLGQAAADAIVAVTLGAGINWFDTAEMYGGGRSESVLARALLAAGRRDGDVVIATKWLPFFRTAASIRGTIAERRGRLAPFGIDLYQVHQPVAFASTAAQMNAMADLVEAGQVQAVGVSNFSARRMRRAHAALAARGVPLASNQVRYSLLDRRIERNGVLDAAVELGVTVIAYSPLAQGILSGKYHREPDLIRARPGPRRLLPAFSRRGLARSTPLVDALNGIAAGRGATPSQVALSWLIHSRGATVVAIPGATSAGQAEENAHALALRLTDAESGRLEELSRPWR